MHAMSETGPRPDFADTKMQARTPPARDIGEIKGGIVRIECIGRVLLFARKTRHHPVDVMVSIDWDAVRTSESSCKDWILGDPREPFEEATAWSGSTPVILHWVDLYYRSLSWFLRRSLTLRLSYLDLILSGGIAENGVVVVAVERKNVLEDGRLQQLVSGFYRAPRTGWGLG